MRTREREKKKEGKEGERERERERERNERRKKKGGSRVRLPKRVYRVEPPQLRELLPLLLW
jgi:hypothetical protein